jgi:hypothetical protein
MCVCVLAVIYSAGFYITIEKLRPDFLGTTGEAFDGFRGVSWVWGGGAAAQ